MEKDSLQNTIVHDLFELTIAVKGISGFLEIVIGTVFLFLKTESVYNAIIAASHSKIIGHSGQTATNYLVYQANHFSLSTKYFVAAYFLFYGIVNLFLVISLLKGKMWAYPAAIVFFLLFITYQCYRSLLHHSTFLLLLTIFDMCLVLLTWLEYQRIKNKTEKPVI